MNNRMKSEYKRYILKNKLRVKVEYRLNQASNIFLKKPYRRKNVRIAGRRVGTCVEGNAIIGNLIKSGKPFWVSRYGNSERVLMRAVLSERYLGISDNLEKAREQLCSLSGFFPNDYDLFIKYTDMILSYSKDIDAHGTWVANLEEYLISQFSKDTKLFKYGGLDPWTAYGSNGSVLPWSHYLKGKKVLVVHPFADTIEKQYESKRKYIFSNRYSNYEDILPDFELKTLKAVQTLASNKDERFGNWFEALDWMVSECRKIDFDIAIVGCGAYGFPLSGEIKRMGKSAIQMCGTTQLLFGIMGNRWKDNMVIQSMVNDYWTYPSENEKISDVKKIENSCYW